jgi:hypothetical protein
LARKVNLRRSDKDKGSFFWAKNCGECHPGGGPAEYDRRGNRYDEFAADPNNRIEHMGDNYLDGDYYQAGWVNSGVTEADCLICHLEGYDWQARSLALRGGFLAKSATVGAGWYRNMEKTAPPTPGIPPQAASLVIDYTRADIVDPEKIGERIVRAVPDQNCWSCHKGPNMKKRGRTWDSGTDIHKARGLTCVYCHPAGEDHEIAKGDVLIGSVRKDLDNTMKSCADCHINGADPRATPAKHMFPDLHIEKMTCESCHIPYKDNPAVGVIDNATTGTTISYKTTDFTGGDPLDPDNRVAGIPSTRWYPAFVWFKGKIKPVDPMLTIWWGDWDRASHRVIPIPLWRIREFTGASAENNFNVADADLAAALKKSTAVNTPSEITTYLRRIADARDTYGMPLAAHTVVLVKGGRIYYMQDGKMRNETIPVHEGEFDCCEPFDLSHNIVSGSNALGAGGCGDCHIQPSPFFNRKVLKDPFDENGRPIYQEAWELLDYSRERMSALTRQMGPQ